MTVSRYLLLAGFVSALLLGCASTPAPKPLVPASRPPALEKFQHPFDAMFRLEYQIERKISATNGKSCFAFITGTLHNQSPHTLSKQSVIDVSVLSQGKLLFRDITNPVEHIPPEGRAAFLMVTSPVHEDGCPAYDLPKLALRKVFLNP